MSRVRILNLPNDCTEEQLRQHILRTAPASAPPLDITDVMIKRSTASPTPSRGHRRQAPRSVIRMAFVGFQNASAGNFVVQYFNKTFFRNARITVEPAKGLNDVGITTNMRKRQRQAEELIKSRSARREGEESEASGMARAEGGDVPSRTNADDADTEEQLQQTNDARQAARRQQFIAERTKATGGPTWSAEVLVPDAEAEPATGLAPAVDSGSSAAAAAVGGPAGVGSDVPVDEEAEREALERQQALGEVSDIDFLLQLNAKENKGDADAAPNAEANASEHDEPTAQTPAVPSGVAQDTAAEASPEDVARASRRVRLGNLPYVANEDHVRQFASSLVGPVEAVHIPLTRDTKQSKGAAFIRFVHAEDAVRALTLCRGAILMGRLLRVSASEEDPHSHKALEREAQQATTTLGDLAGSSDYKIKKEMKLRQQQAAAQRNGGANISWNTMYMNSHTAVEAVAQRLGVAAQEVVAVEAKGAAVRAAIAEAYLTSEVQQVLSDDGIAFDVLDGAQQNLLKPRSNTTILVKNLHLTTPADAAELSKLFVRFGALEVSVFPAAGAFALFRYTHPQDARVAFTRLSYKIFQNSPLFLEWAPVGSIIQAADDVDGRPAEVRDGGDDEDNDAAAAAVAAAAKHQVFTLFITNISFDATEDELHAFMMDACPRLAKAPDQLIQRLVHQRELGRAFLTVADQSTFAYCQAKLNGRTFAGRVLSCVASKHTAVQQASTRLAAHAGGEGKDDDNDDEFRKTTAVIANRGQHAAGGAQKNSNVPPGCDPLKIIVKNLPFEATERDVRELFAAFSEVRSVRVPRKSHNFSTHRENNHRGFAFVEFLSEAEAARAMETLRATHLYGRHLVLQYAKLDS